MSYFYCHTGDVLISKDKRCLVKFVYKRREQKEEFKGELLETLDVEDIHKLTGNTPLYHNFKYENYIDIRKINKEEINKKFEKYIRKEYRHFLNLEEKIMKAEDELNDMKKELFLKKLKDDSIKKFEISLSYEKLNELVGLKTIIRDIRNKVFECYIGYIRIKITILPFNPRLSIEKIGA